MPSAGEDVSNRNSHSLLRGMKNHRAIMEDSSSQFIKKKKKSLQCGKKNVIFAVAFIKLKIFLFIHEIWPWPCDVICPTVCEINECEKAEVWCVPVDWGLPSLLPGTLSRPREEVQAGLIKEVSSRTNTSHPSSETLGQPTCYWTNTAKVTLSKPRRKSILLNYTENL